MKVTFDLNTENPDDIKALLHFSGFFKPIPLDKAGSNKELENHIAEVNKKIAQSVALTPAQIDPQQGLTKGPVKLPPVVAQGMEDQKKEMTAVANQLDRKTGTKTGKMTPSERASVAAKARWAKHHAEKAGKNVKKTKKRVVKKNKRKTASFGGAKEHSAEDFEQLEAKPSDFFNGQTLGPDQPKIQPQQPAPELQKVQVGPVGRELIALDQSMQDDFPDGKDILEGNYESSPGQPWQEPIDNPLEDVNVREIHERAKSYESN